MRLSIPALLAALTLALTACSAAGSEEPAEPAADTPAAVAGAVTFVGTSNLQWEQTSRSATLAEGPLEVTIECEGAVPHNVAFAGVEGDAIIAECSGDDVGSGTIDVGPGTYTYYCVIPGHRTAGMEGTISIS